MEEVVAAGLDGVDVVALLGSEGAFLEEGGETQHAVHGSADLVAHHGEKFALGAIGREGGFDGTFLRGDINFDADHAGGGAFFVPDDDGARPGVAQVAIGQDDAAFDLVRGRVGGKAPGKFRLDAWPIIGVEDLNIVGKFGS